MIKHLITGGCSFSTGGDTHNWTGCVTRYLKGLNPNLTTTHTAEISQGQELIQKKVLLAITDALAQGYKGEEIFVCVMWSGIGRKAWYVDNPIYIQKLVNGWKNFNGGISSQFLDLYSYKNGIKNKELFKTKYSEAAYNTEGGWYYTVDGSDSAVEGFREQYLLDSEPSGPGKVNTSLENIIFLQNFCKLHKIRLLNQIFMSQVFKDIFKQKDHQAVSYLYKQIDFENFIKIGALDFVLSQYNLTFDQYRVLDLEDKTRLQQSAKLLESDLFHLNNEGFIFYYKNILHSYIERLIND